MLLPLPGQGTAVRDLLNSTWLRNGPHRLILRTARTSQSDLLLLWDAASSQPQLCHIQLRNQVMGSIKKSLGVTGPCPPYQTILQIFCVLEGMTQTP